MAPAPIMTITSNIVAIITVLDELFELPDLGVDKGELDGLELVDAGLPLT